MATQNSERVAAAELSIDLKYNRRLSLTTISIRSIAVGAKKQLHKPSESVSGYRPKVTGQVDWLSQESPRVHAPGVSSYE